jgi:hypothetical protein
MTPEKQSEYELELVTGALYGNLTEQRYIELLDILLPAVVDPEAQAGLMGCGSLEWRKRYVERVRKQTAA